MANYDICYHCFNKEIKKLEALSPPIEDIKNN